MKNLARIPHNISYVLQFVCISIIGVGVVLSPFMIGFVIILLAMIPLGATQLTDALIRGIALRNSKPQFLIYFLLASTYSLLLYLSQGVFEQFLTQFLGVKNESVRLSFYVLFWGLIPLTGGIAYFRIFLKEDYELMKTVKNNKHENSSEFV